VHAGINADRGGHVDVAMVVVEVVVVGRKGKSVGSIPLQRHRPGLRGGVLETTGEGESGLASEKHRTGRLSHGHTTAVAVGDAGVDGRAVDGDCDASTGRQDDEADEDWSLKRGHWRMLASLVIDLERIRGPSWEEGCCLSVNPRLILSVHYSRTRDEWDNSVGLGVVEVLRGVGSAGEEDDSREEMPLRVEN
jgi:hypothetical protein